MAVSPRHLRTRHPASAESKPDAAPAAVGRVELSVVVPVYNERATLRALLAELRPVLDGLERRWEIVLVDDGSTDGTFGEFVEVRGSDPRLRMLRLRRNSGKAKALATGFRHARGTFVVTMDSDLQDDPREIPKLLAKLDEGFDLVSGWKAKRNDPWSRRLASKIFNGVVRRVTRTTLHDANCGLKAYRREVVEDIKLYGELHRFIPVLAHFEGYRIAEVPVHHRPRAEGRSRYGLERYVRGCLDLVTVLFIAHYRHRPLHLFGGVGMLLGGAGFIVCLYLTALKISGEAIGGRPLLTLGVLLILLGVQCVFMGLLGEMLMNLHEEQAQRRRRDGVAVDEVV